MSGNAGGIRAAKAFVEMYVNNNALQKGLKQTEARLRQFQGGIAKLTGGMFDWRAMLAGGGMAGFVGKEFATFEQSMARVSTMLEGKEAHAYMQRFSDGVKRMALESGKDLNEIADGLKEILSASVEPKDALAMLNNANRMAIAADTTIGQSVFTLIGIMNSYGLSATETGRISDILFESVKWGTMTVSGLSEAIGTVAPMANAAGMELEDLMAVMSTLTRAGLSADEAGVRVNAMLKQMPGSMRDALAVAKQFQGMDLANVNKMIPEIRAAQGFAILGNNVAGLARDMKAMRNSAGSTEQAFQKMAGTLMTWFNRVRQAVKEVGIAFGEVFGMELKEFSEISLRSIVALKKWIEKSHDTIINFAKGAAGIIAIGAAFKFISLAAGMAGAAISILNAAMFASKAVIGSLFGGLMLLANPLKLLGYLMGGLWSVMPLVAVGAAVYYSGALGAIARAATDCFGSIVTAIKTGEIKTASQLLMYEVQMIWQRGLASIEEVWNGAISAMAKADNMIYFYTSQKTFLESAKTIWENWARNVGDMYGALVGGLTKLLLRLGYAMRMTAAWYSGMWSSWNPGEAYAEAMKRIAEVKNNIDLGSQLSEIDKEMADNAGERLASLEQQQRAWNKAIADGYAEMARLNSQIDSASKADKELRQNQIEAIQAKIEAAKKAIYLSQYKKINEEEKRGQKSAARRNVNTLPIMARIEQARTSSLVGRGFSWNSAGSDTKSKELSVAEESRDYLRRIETNVRDKQVVWGQ